MELQIGNIEPGKGDYGRSFFTSIVQYICSVTRKKEMSSTFTLLPYFLPASGGIQFCD